MDDKKKQAQQLNIELSEEIAQGIYSNLAVITHSSSEFVVDFVRIMPGIPKANVKSRIILTPEHAKRLLLALQDNVKKFEAIQDQDSIYGREAMDYKTAFSLFASGMAALEKNNIEEAQSNLDRLDALFWRNSQLENEKERISNFKRKTLLVTSAELEGNILVAEKSYEKGIKMLEKAVQMEKDLGYSEPPYYPRPVLISLASAYLKTGDYEKAASSYHKILEKHPNSSMAYWGLMKVYKASKQQDQYKNAKLQFEEVTRYGDRVVFN